jgi:hypothetical protein
MPRLKQILKRSLLAIVALFGIACIIVIATSKSEVDRNAPRFVPGAPADAITNLATMANYSWGDDIPFQSNRIWLWTATSRTNFHSYWVNLDDLTIKGELIRASAVFCNKEQTKLLCSGHSPLFPALKERFANWLEKASGGKFKAKLNRAETFWILDLRNNQAKCIGSFSQSYGSGSRWHPAPGFRFGYNIPSTSRGEREFYLCDLEQEKMTLVPNPPGSVQGWWDDHRLLMAAQHNFLLYDVITRQSTNLFTSAQLQQFLKQSNLPDGLDQFAATPTWTGDSYTFLFSARTNWAVGSYYLLKNNTGEMSPVLEVFKRDFQFQQHGRFNSDATLYVFPGETGQPGQGGNGSVHIRDVQTGETRTLVESDQSNQYTLPRLYKNRVIYTKSRQLWSIDVNGSNHFKLFQLPTNGTQIAK